MEMKPLINSHLLDELAIELDLFGEAVPESALARYVAAELLSLYSHTVHA